MEKKTNHFCTEDFLASVLLGMFAGFLGVNPLGISQAQVIIALKSLFIGLGMLTVILTFYFTRKKLSGLSELSKRRRGRRKTNKTTLLCIVS